VSDARGASADSRFAASTRASSGSSVEIDEAAKREVLEAMTCRYFVARTAGRDYADASGGELRGTALSEVVVEELSAKSRRGGPGGRSTPTTPPRARVV
jgi:hypothetical protein